MLAGPGTVENSLITGAGQAAIVAATGSLTLRDSTLAGSSAGVSALGGAAVTVTQSIVWGNGSPDLQGVGCAAVTWSDTGSPCCGPANGNICADPMFVATAADEPNLRLAAGTSDGMAPP